MIESRHLTEYLDDIRRLNPHVVHTDLKKGDEFSTHPYPTTTRYVIINPEIHEEFGYPKDFGAFLIEVGKRLQGTTPAQILNRLFPPGKNVCDISEAVRLNIGMCLEKATMITLRTQHWYKSILVKGLISTPQFGRTFHAFNILAPESGVNLADAQNPIILKTNEGKTHVPFCFPLKGYDEETKRFIFEDPYEQNIRWQYQLPLNVKIP